MQTCGAVQTVELLLRRTHAIWAAKLRASQLQARARRIKATRQATGMTVPKIPHFAFSEAYSA